ncbi:hypothetical protein Cantr_09165 [Candida viswanathii]|uniref:Uncharacterized protein n=1 Tax=Candida viswanathii TaxID=5486 RepID=A0A367YCK9_9ASCO|nr:hypothetical protein Cantr_09165 [Candida viswanathii]
MEETTNPPYQASKMHSKDHENPYRRNSRRRRAGRIALTVAGVAALGPLYLLVHGSCSCYRHRRRQQFSDSVLPPRVPDLSDCSSVSTPASETKLRSTTPPPPPTYSRY